MGATSPSADARHAEYPFGKEEVRTRGHEVTVTANTDPSVDRGVWLEVWGLALTGEGLIAPPERVVLFWGKPVAAGLSRAGGSIPECRRTDPARPRPRAAQPLVGAVHGGFGQQVGEVDAPAGAPLALSSIAPVACLAPPPHPSYPSIQRPARPAGGSDAEANPPRDPAPTQPRLHRPPRDRHRGDHAGRARPPRGQRVQRIAAVEAELKTLAKALAAENGMPAAVEVMKSAKK